MVVQELQIAGYFSFSSIEWRKALLFFTRQVNRAGSEVRSWPKILFTCDEGHVLTLGRFNGQYYAYGNLPHVHHEQQMTVVDARQCRLIERSLMRLEEVGAPMTVVLHADAQLVSTVTLWTDSDDGMLYVSAYQLPRSVDTSSGFVRYHSSPFVH